MTSYTLYGAEVSYFTGKARAYLDWRGADYEEKPATQDGRALRRYARRYKVERSISWLFHLKRLVVRYEYHAFLFQGFVQLGCLFTILKGF